MYWKDEENIKVEVGQSPNDWVVKGSGWAGCAGFNS
jgi:hypothetical protein